jgi:integrase
MRRGELLGVRWKDIHGSTLSIEQQVVDTPGGATFGPPKSERGVRTLDLDPETVEALERHRQLQLLERALAADAYQDVDLVICREDGSPFRPTRIPERFGAICAAAGLPKSRLHDLRHTATTHLLNEGVGIHEVAARIGDTETAILNTYANVIRRASVSAAEKAAAIV